MRAPNEVPFVNSLNGHSQVKPFLTLLLLSLGLIAAQAQDALIPRIAVVDMTVVFLAHPETVKAEGALESQRKEAREIFKTKSEELKKVLQEHQKVTADLVAAGTAASSTDKAAAKALLDQAMKLEKEIAELRTTQESDLKRGYVDERRRILGQIQTTIAKFNADGGYHLILDKSAASANGIPQILHAPGVDDITEKIIQLVQEEADQ